MSTFDVEVVVADKSTLYNKTQQVNSILRAPGKKQQVRSNLPRLDIGIAQEHAANQHCAHVSAARLNDRISQTTRAKASNLEPFINRETLSCFSYIGGVVAFITAANIRSLPVVPYPLIRNLQDEIFVDLDMWHGDVLLIFFWGFSYCRKVMVFVMKYKYTKPITSKTNAPTVYIENGHEVYPKEKPPINYLHYIIPLLLYHCIFGLWCGWAVNTFSLYQTSDVQYYSAGFVVYVCGELLAWPTCVYMSRTRGDMSTCRVRLCAELCELLSKTGFSIMAMTMASYAQLICRTFLALFAIIIPCMDSQVF